MKNKYISLFFLGVLLFLGQGVQAQTCTIKNQVSRNIAMLTKQNGSETRTFNLIYTCQDKAVFTPETSVSLETKSEFANLLASLQPVTAYNSYIKAIVSYGGKTYAIVTWNFITGEVSGNLEPLTINGGPREVVVTLTGDSYINSKMFSTLTPRPLWNLLPLYTLGGVKTEVSLLFISIPDPCTADAFTVNAPPSIDFNSMSIQQLNAGKIFEKPFEITVARKTGNSTCLGALEPKIQFDVNAISTTGTLVELEQGLSFGLTMNNSQLPFGTQVPIVQQGSWDVSNVLRVPLIAQLQKTPSQSVKTGAITGTLKYTIIYR